MLPLSDSRCFAAHGLLYCLLGCLFIGGVAANMAVAQAPGNQGVAVLNDGRVYQGAVQEVPGGYRVHYPGGSSILPFNQISVTSATLVGAYEAFRNNIRTPNADAHLRLAEWCLANGLYAQADIEVQAALQLEPVRSDAQAILRQVDAILRPEIKPAAPVVKVTPPPRAAITVAAFTSPEDRNNAGLTRETQLNYMRKVQPLIINKCGNAGCHGPNVENQLRLKNARSDSPGLRLATEHNLSMLFSMIDYQQPQRSPLLTKPLESTSVHRNLFLGTRQQSQFEILDNWVRQVAQERDPATALTNTGPRAGTAPSRMTSILPGQPIQYAAAEAISANSPGKLPAIPRMSPLASSNSQLEMVSSGDPQLLERIRQSHRPDAFDPNEFNRLMHPEQMLR